MMGWLRRRRRTIFGATIAVFLIGIFVGLGGYLFTSSDTSGSVAVVAGAKIPTLRYQVRVNQYLDALREQAKDRDIPEGMIQEVKQGMLRDMVVEEILAQQAGKLGLRVSDLELSLSIRNSPRFQRGGAFDQGLYFQAVRQGLRTTPEDFENQQRKALAGDKLKQLLFAAAKLAPQEAEEEYRRQLKNPKTAEKDKEKFVRGLQQARALDLVNFFLRQISARIDIRFFLDQREQGA